MLSGRVLFVAGVLTLFLAFYAFGPLWTWHDGAIRSLGRVVCFGHSVVFAAALDLTEKLAYSGLPPAVRVVIGLGVSVGAGFLLSILYSRVIVGVYEVLEDLPFQKEWCKRIQRFYAGGITLFLILIAANNPAVFTHVHPGSPRSSCRANLHNISLALALYKNDHGDALPEGGTTGMVFRQLNEKGYLRDLKTLQCPAIRRHSPRGPLSFVYSYFTHYFTRYKCPEAVDFGAPQSIDYYIDVNVPAVRHDKRAIAADRFPWEVNHQGAGVNVLFEDGSVHFVRPEDSGPQNTISNPFIEEDTDIYSDTGDPKKHAWIRWKREPENE